MFVVGAILIVLAIIVVIYVTFATRNLDPLSIDWGPFTAALTPLQLFFLGAVAILVLAIGAVMFSIGLKGQGAKRAEVKRLRKEVKQGQTEQQAQRDSQASSDSHAGSKETDTTSKTRTKDVSDRKAGSGPSSTGSNSQTQTSKLPPALPPRDSTTPPPRSGV